MAERILEELEMREAIFTYRYKFAIDYRIVLYAFQCFRNFDVVVADDLAVAAVEGDLTALNCCDHAKAVILILEDPGVIMKRRIGERGEHRLQTFRQSRRARHGYALRWRRLRNHKLTPVMKIMDTNPLMLIMNA